MSECVQVPLTDLLDDIPLDARMTYEVNPTHHHMIPVGRHAAEASARIKALERENEVLRAERDQSRARVDNAVKLLLGIHALLYPSPIKIADGRTMVFRPKDSDPHTILQELSDRIRALPDTMAECAAAIRAQEK